MKRIGEWAKGNVVALLLVVSFIPIFIVSQNADSVFNLLGTTSMDYLNHEYYRWITCIFLHFNFEHIFFNSTGLLAISSLLSPLVGKWRILLIFLLGGALAEVSFSIIVKYGGAYYSGGSSGGIFALIAAFVVCYLRFPNTFRIK